MDLLVAADALRTELVDMAPGLAGFVQTVALVWAASWVALLVHELSHAAAARALGVRLWGMQLGIGPTLLQGTVAGCRVRVAILPLVGSVALLDADAVAIGYRDIRPGSWRFEWVRGAWRAPIISAAGAVGNLAAAFGVVAFWAWAGRPDFEMLLGQFCLAAFATNISGYLNLVPCFSSDGKHLLHHMVAARRRLAPEPLLG
ncbi:MAG TPA: site-2 protease family protein [Gemmatimonadales bacterium]|nr:site-2 protease family protein [Gemmatimonadales bacterium]